MKTKNRLPEPTVFQSVVEWRYPKAHRYWDDCGKLIAAIEQTFPGLVCQGLEKTGFVFRGSASGLTAATFAWDRSNIDADRGDAGFAENALAFWELVRDILQPSNITRLGHRSWLLFETESAQMAIRHLDNLAIWRFEESDHNLGYPITNDCVLRTRLEPGGRKSRIEVNAGTIESKRTRKKQHGVVVDVDLVVEKPDRIPDDPGQFVLENQRFIREVVQPFFRRK